VGAPIGVGAPDRRPGQVTIDIDATLLTAHSEKLGAAGTFEGGFGFHPLMAYCDQRSETLAGLLRPSNAGREHRR